MKKTVTVLLLNLFLLTMAACSQTVNTENPVATQINKIEDQIINHIFETAGPTASQIDEAEKQMANQLDQAENEVNKIIITKPENKIITSFDDYIVSGKRVRSKPNIYRKLLGQTPQNWYVVQDFYKESHKKRTDPFIIKNKNQLTEILPEHEEGILISWSEDGGKAIKAHNKNRQKDGLTILYGDGQQMIVTNYKNGEVDGLSMAWHKNGQKSSMMYYKNGKPDSLSISWYENGQKQAVQNIKEGKWEGAGFNWYENGAKNIYSSYKNNKPEGTWIIWYKNGQKKSETTLQNGKPRGTQTFWNKDGTIREKRDYGEGKLIKETKP